MTPFWTRERINRFAAAILIALLAATFLSLKTAQTTSALYQGDFASFYSAGRLVLEGRSTEIYNLKSLAEIQSRYWPAAQGVFPMAYPAFWPVLFAPLTLFSPMVAKALICCGLLLALYGTIRLSSSYVPFFRDYQFASWVLILSFPPLFHGTVAAQNTAISLLLLAGSLYFAQSTKGNDILSGMFLGLWLFKPHLSGLVIATFLIARRFRVLLGIMPVAIIYYALGSYSLGFYWPLSWKTGLSVYVPLDYAANQHQMVSLMGTAHALETNLRLSDFWTGILIATATYGSLAIMILALWSAHKRLKGNLSDENLFSMVIFEMIAISLLVSPHTVYYDVGLLLIPGAYYLRFVPKPGAVVLGVYLFSTLAVLLKDTFEVQPLVLITAIAPFLFQTICNRRQVGHQTPLS